jgi:predicted nucleotidyltransferase
MAESIDEMLAPTLTECDAALATGYSAVLFGSAARGDWAVGESDLNLLLVADALGATHLRALQPAFERLRRVSGEAPLLFSRAEWAVAHDAFPVEITDMQLAYRVLRGSDPLSGIQVPRPELRTALEREWRGKLLQLRRGYVTLSGDEVALGRLAAQSIGSILLLCRVSLALFGEVPPLEAGAIVAKAAGKLGMDGEVLVALVRQRRGTPLSARREQFEAYLGAVECAVRVIDQFDTGEHA